MLAEKLYQLLDNKLVLWLGLLISSTGLILYSFFNLYFFLYPTKIPQRDLSSSNVAHHQQPNDKSLFYPLFGNYIPKSHDKDAIPKTLLNIKLVGVLKASKKHLSQITIQVSGGKEKNYSLGDELPGGAKLIRIYDDSALIMRNGRVERLSLPTLPLSNTSMTKPLEFES